jgi:acetoacetate decarboxylase
MKTADLVQNACVKPLTRPSFPRGPYRYSNRELLIITYHTDRAELVL